MQSGSGEEAAECPEAPPWRAAYCIFGTAFASVHLEIQGLGRCCWVKVLRGDAQEEAGARSQIQIVFSALYKDLPRRHKECSMEGMFSMMLSYSTSTIRKRLWSCDLLTS